MNNKKQQQIKTVHRFTQTARMKFRPQLIPVVEKKVQNEGGIFNKLTSALGKLLFLKGSNANNTDKVVEEESSFTSSRGENSMRNSRISTKTYLKSDKQTLKDSSILLHPLNDEQFGLHNIAYLQKLTPDTFIIGNYHQLDCITISGIYQNQVDTQYNWNLHLKKKIEKVAVQTRKGTLAIQCQNQLLVYELDLKKYQKSPLLKTKVKIPPNAQYLLFLKQNFISIFYKTYGMIYQLEQNGTLKQIFNKKYNVAQSLELFQIPKPFQTTLNIFFIQKNHNVNRDSKKDSSSNTFSSNSDNPRTNAKKDKPNYIILWKIQLQFKHIGASSDYKHLTRIYDIPLQNLQILKIDNHSKSISILNFKHEILAAKDGFIIDNANTHFHSEDQYLLYHGDKLIHINDNKLFIYSFRIKLQQGNSGSTNTSKSNTNISSDKSGGGNKIEISSLDSIDINLDRRYQFLDCLEMFNGNWVIFYQIKPQQNKKLKGQLDYTLAVTQKLSVKQKLNEIFNFKDPDELKHLSQHNFSLIQEKCDMAFKIGLNRKQVYLQLWNKSNKKDVQDYKFLLDTMDYQTIKREVQNKLRKSSMPFSQVYKLEQGCFQMLRVEVFGTDCSQQKLKNFYSSHLLIRKLNFYKNISVTFNKNMKEIIVKNANNEEYTTKMICIDIQQYTQICQMDLKNFFNETVSKIMAGQKEGGQEQKKLRIFLREFKFSLRIIYKQLLEQLIVHCKGKLVTFLRIIPEILPIYPQQAKSQNLSGTNLRFTERSIKQGIWSGQIKPQEWSANLHLDEISTIYNKDLLQEISKTLWFKRNHYIHHDMINLSKEKIVQIQRSNQSQEIFYFFIERIFHHQEKIQNEGKENMERLICFLQGFCFKIPQHLIGKIFLYRKIYLYFKKEKYNSTKVESFDVFLKLKDHEFFKEIFNYQKIKKGCLLKDVKSIYQTLPNGKTLYYQGLLHYFQSQISQISDLKYMLNRLNSQKQQFHIENEGIYNMLVQALQMKLRLGSENDIPIDQVMIYIENIPLSKDNRIIEELNIITKVKEKTEMFQKMKINLSIKEIITKCQHVMTCLINYQIEDRKIFTITNLQQFLQASYDLIAEAKTFKETLYGQQHYKDLQYFLYLSKIMQKQSFLAFAQTLLKDQNLLQFYDIDQIMVENLVVYMYKWKFNQQIIYQNNQPYIKELLSLLGQSSKWRQYIQYQLELALYLTTQSYKVEYPLAKGNSTVTVQQISEIFTNYTVEQLLGLDLNLIYNLVRSMQELWSQQQEQYELPSQDQIQKQEKPEIIQLEQLYEQIIMRLIHLKDVKSSISYIKTLINLTEMYNNGQLMLEQNNQEVQINQNIPRSQKKYYSIVFCYLILEILLMEVPDNNRKKMLSIIYKLNDQPHELISFIQRRISLKLSNNQEEQFLSDEFQKVSQNKIYNGQNILFDEEILRKLSDAQTNIQKVSKKFQEILYHVNHHISLTRQDFRIHIQYHLYFLILLNDPYALIKYLSVKKEQVNLKLLRSYLSYVFREDVFDGLKVLYFGRRCFTILMEHYTNNQKGVEKLVAEYRDFGFQDDFLEVNSQEIQQLLKVSPPICSKLHKSIQVFNKKIRSMKKGNQKDSQYRMKKIKRIEDIFKFSSSVLSMKSNEVEEYPFNDSDDNYQEDYIQQRMIKSSYRVQHGEDVQKNKKKRVEFDPDRERQFLMARENKNNIGLYLSSTGGNFNRMASHHVPNTTQGKDAGEHISVRVKETKSVVDPFKSLHLSGRRKSPSIKNNLTNSTNNNKANNYKFKITDRINSIESQAYEESLNSPVLGLNSPDFNNKNKVNSNFDNSSVDMFHSIQPHKLMMMEPDSPLFIKKMTKEESPSKEERQKKNKESIPRANSVQAVVGGDNKFSSPNQNQHQRGSSDLRLPYARQISPINIPQLQQSFQINDQLKGVGNVNSSMKAASNNAKFNRTSNSKLNSGSKSNNKRQLLSPSIKQQQQYLAPYYIVKQLLQSNSKHIDINSSPLSNKNIQQSDKPFNLMILINQESKDLSNFQAYLKDIIIQAYNFQTDIPLLTVLHLIKQIKSHYAQKLSISESYLQYYLNLQIHNLKLKSELKIRDIFPAEGLFIQSQDPMMLFDFVKPNIVQMVDYDQIIILKQILRLVFKKNEINDELYICFLGKLISDYGNDTQSSEVELKMMKERISGLLSQIVMVVLLLEKGEGLLRLIKGNHKQRREEICGLIKDVFVNKKKGYLVKQFQKKVLSIMSQ